MITRRVLGLGLVAGSAACATAQTGRSTEPEAALDQRLLPLARFVGEWRGVAEGEPGTGTVTRSYAPILAGKFIEERNESRYASGEIHHHLGFWSCDRARGRFVFRQFHQESFVNQFVAATADFVDGRLVADSESIEHIPPATARGKPTSSRAPSRTLISNATRTTASRGRDASGLAARAYRDQQMRALVLRARQRL